MIILLVEHILSFIVMMFRQRDIKINGTADVHGI